MSAHVAVPLPSARWAYLKALKPSRRYLHISAPIVRNPLAVAAQLQNKVFVGPQFLIQRPGKTYNIGRNRAKREARRKKWVPA